MYEGTQFHCVKFRLGSAGEQTICSHCYSVPYMKIPANNQVIFAKYQQCCSDLNELKRKSHLLRANELSSMTVVVGRGL